jgi:hypothetical protein
MTPLDDQTAVDVFISPQVAFNLPVNEPFKIKDVNDREYEYKIDIEDISIYQNGLPVAGDIKLNYDNSVAAVQTANILKSQTDYSFRASLIFMERSGSRWKPLIRGGKPYREEKEVKFKSGIAPDYIPKENIEYAYPIPGDAYFYSDYSNEGFLKLKKGQPELFQSEGMQHNVEFVNAEQIGQQSTLNYSNGLIEYEIPKLVNGVGYKVRYSSSPIEEVNADQNLADSYIAVNESAQVLERTLTGSISLDYNKTLLEYDINVSRYDRLSVKVDTWSRLSFYLDSSPIWYLKNLVSSYQGDELIGSDEDSSTGVVEVSAVLSNSVYYNERVYPLVYDGYPLDGDIIVDRETKILGLPPVKAVNLIAEPSSLRMSWDLTPVMAKDFLDIQKQVVRRYINQRGAGDRFREIILGQYPVDMYGNFDVMIRYKIPGTDRIADEFPLRFFLPKEY